MASQCGAIKRLAPRFPGVVVDGFNFQSPDDEAYVLTHFHSDHYCGLSSSFNSKSSTRKLIYGTKITCSLVVEFLKVDPECVRPVEYGETFPLRRSRDLDRDDEIEATFIDANHCPGAAIVLFKNKTTGDTLLHTGDFRAAACVRESPILKQLLASSCRDGVLDEVMLDTTYCEKKWTFPDQSIVLDKMREIAAAEIKREPRTLFICGSYALGKERAISAVCRGAQSRASVTARRKKSLELSGWWNDEMFACEEDDSVAAAQCRVRVVGLGKGSNHKAMMEIIKKEAPRWNAVVAFSPTGWSYTKKMDLEGFTVKPWIEYDGRTRVYAIPYSEHSSYTELREFIRSLKPKKITPTVNAVTKQEREKLVNKHFLDLIDLKSDANKLDYYFQRGGVGALRSKPKKTKTEIIVIESENDDDDCEVKVEAEVLAALDGDVETIRRQREMWKRVTTAKPKPQTLEPFPLECIAVVKSGEYTQFRSRAHVEQRLKELGATIMSRITPNVTHIIVPAKGEMASEAARLNSLRQMEEYKDESVAVRVTESWVMRHVRARNNNCAASHSEQELAAFEAKKREEKLAKSAAAKRKREEKKMAKNENSNLLD